MVEEWPARDQLGGHVLEEGEVLLGLYEGIPLTERSDYGMVLPDRITLFQEAIESVCDSPEEVVEEIRKTVRARGGPPLRHRRRQAVGCWGRRGGCWVLDNLIHDRVLRYPGLVRLRCFHHVWDVKGDLHNSARIALGALRPRYQILHQPLRQEPRTNRRRPESL